MTIKLRSKMLSFPLLAFLFLGATAGVVNSNDQQQEHEQELLTNLRSRYLREYPLASLPHDDIFVTHVQNGKVSSKNKPLPIETKRRQLQMTIPQGIKNVYRKPKKGDNNRRKKGGGRSTKKSSSSKKSSDSDSDSYRSKSKKSSSKKSESKRRKKSRSSSRSSSSTSTSRSPRKKKKSLFKKVYSKSRTTDSSKSKRKKKNTNRSGGSRHKKSKDTSKTKKRKKDKSRDSKSENKQCHTKEDVNCRDACISDSCGFHGDEMCIRRCKQECCTSTSNQSSDDETTAVPTPTPTPAPVSEGGPGPAPEPTTPQPVVPVTPAPTPEVVGLSCPSDTTSLAVPGSLGCSEGGCCIIDTTSNEGCNYAAFEAAGDSTTQEGQVLVSNIDTSEDGPFQIDEGCPVACTSECRLSPGTLPPAPAPPPTNRFAGPGTILCPSITGSTDGGYCETTEPTLCNTAGLAENGDLTTTEDGKTVVSNIFTAEPVPIESGCLIDCAECTFGRASL